MTLPGACTLLVASSLLLAACASTPSGGEGFGESADSVTLSPNAQTAYQYFVGKGLTSCQAAGIVGNLEQESNIDPTISQEGGGPGRGIAQWSAGGRWDTDKDDNVAWYAQQQGESEDSLSLQLGFIWYELETFSSYGLASLRGSASVSDATVAFQNDFEGCGTCDESTRIAYAQSALSAYGGGSCSGGGSGSGGGGGGSGSSSGGTTTSFPGTYACTVSTTADLTTPDLGDKSGDGTGTVVITQSGSTLDARISGSAGVTCTLRLTVMGSGAVVASGQTCSAESTMVARIESGAVALTGTSLEGHFAFALSGTYQGESVVGTGTQTSACTKQ